MKVVVPFTEHGLLDETVLAVRASSDSLVSVLLDGREIAAVPRPTHPVEFALLEDDEAYWRLWRDLWAAGEDVIVVEHDIVPTPDVFRSFRECPEPWCAYPYEYAHFGVYAGTGCVRFRAELLQATPLLIDRVGALSDSNHPQRHWCRLDAWMQFQLHDAGFRQHRHTPPVRHLGSGVAHGCC